MAKTSKKYGCTWAADNSPLWIELQCIARGGRWTGKNGQQCGDGLFWHKLQAFKLALPKRYVHRWTELILKESSENIFTVFMGSASSQKTSTVSTSFMLDWLASPKDTLFIISTTTIKKLESTIFAQIKTMFMEMKALHPWLPGRIVDYKHAIIYEDDDPDSIRTMDRGIQGIACREKSSAGLGNYAGIKAPHMRIAGDDCFPAGTMIDTPVGCKPIETINIGDVVLCATGPSKVLKIGSRMAKSLMRISTLDGRTIVCTPEHPIFTEKGWIKAYNLSEHTYIISTYESMHLLSEGTYPSPGLVGGKILQQILQRETQICPAGIQREVLQQRKSGKNIYTEDGMVEKSAVFEGSNVEVVEGKSSHAQSGISPKSCCMAKGVWQGTICSRRKWDWTDESRMATNAHVPGRALELSNQDRAEGRKRIPNMLQSRFGASDDKTSDRSGRAITFNLQTKVARLKKGSVLNGSWVERVEILKPGHPEFSKAGGNSEGSRVYNLQVEHHPSYSVNGFLVHNCTYMKSSFLACLPNLYANSELKVAVMGNPEHDINDPLGMAAEPIKGWTTYIEPDVTTIWPVKLYGGKCVNLVGTDSPNIVEFPNEAEHYAGLIGPRYAKLIAANSGGVNSETFKTQVKGVMCLSMARKRVITRDQCTEHHASDEPIWKGVARTKICALDPAYGGGDDCVIYHFEFGTASNGKTIFCITDFRVIPILVLKREDTNFKTPEIQIALAVKADLESHGCPVENCGYDSFGKGTIGQAFAQVFGFTCPVPINAGDRPSTRIVREGEYVMDGTNQTRRLKQWDEHVDRFITELWFRVSYAIDSDQIRGLPEDAIEEGCQRQYKNVGGGKLSIEKKEDLKANNGGRSPNNFDAIAIGLEMAVRHGFVIERLGFNVEPHDEDEEDYYESERRRYDQAINNSLLTPM